MTRVLQVEAVGFLMLCKAKYYKIKWINYYNKEKTSLKIKIYKGTFCQFFFSCFWSLQMDALVILCQKFPLPPKKKQTNIEVQFKFPPARFNAIDFILRYYCTSWDMKKTVKTSLE